MCQAGPRWQSKVAGPIAKVAGPIAKVLSERMSQKWIVAPV